MSRVRKAKPFRRVGKKMTDPPPMDLPDRRSTSCPTGKRPYDSRGEAKTAARRLDRTMTVYPCPLAFDPAHFHIGHADAEERARVRRLRQGVTE